MLYTASILFGDCGRNAERNQKPREHNMALIHICGHSSALFRQCNAMVFVGHKLFFDQSFDRFADRHFGNFHGAVDSFFSMISPFSLPCHCVFFAFFLLRTRTTVTVIAAATTRTQTTRMTAYPQIGMMNATPGIQTMNVPVLSVVILT